MILRHLARAAAAFGHEGLLDRAIADLDLVINADPKYADALRKRGIMRIGDQVGADTDFRRAEALCLWWYLARRLR
jgi:hypothetical protein